MARKKIEVKNGVKIKARAIQETGLSWLLDCEGDQAWFPKSIINFDPEKEELEVPEWKLKELEWIY